MSVCRKATTWLLVLFCGTVATAGAASPQKGREAVQKSFLLRTVDDLANTLGFSEEMRALMEEPAVLPVSTVLPVTGNASRVSRLLREFQQKQVDWLKGIGGEYDRDVERFFAQQKFTPGWVTRHNDLVETFREWTAELDGLMEQLERRRSEQETQLEKLERAVRERRLLLSLDDLELARQLWPNYDHHDFDPREPIYKELSDSEVLQLQSETDRVREMIDTLDTLADLAGYEQRWCVTKGAEFVKLHAVATEFVNPTEGKLDLALEDLASTYDRQSKILGTEIARIEKTIAALNEAPAVNLSRGLARDPRDYYWQFMDRFERHRAWLDIQAESYRLDVVELLREVKNGERMP